MGAESRHRGSLQGVSRDCRRQATDGKPGHTVPVGGLGVGVVSAAGAVVDRPIHGGGAPNPLRANAEAKDPNTTENSQTTGVLVSYRGFTFLDVGDLTWDKEM